MDQRRWRMEPASLIRREAPETNGSGASFLPSLTRLTALKRQVFAAIALCAVPAAVNDRGRERPGYRRVVERGACAWHDAIRRGARFSAMTARTKTPA